VRGSKSVFSVRVRQQIAGNDVLIAIIEPLLVVWHAVREQVAMLDRQILARARADIAARQLMMIPGVGVVVALAYTAVIDDPARFRKSASVGAYLGLTPPRYQSGEADERAHIQMRRWFAAPIYSKPRRVPLCHYSRASTLKTWGLPLAKRIGIRRAKMAISRKLAVVMHRVWSDRSEYRCTEVPAAA
jgi:transposase